MLAAPPSPLRPTSRGGGLDLSPYRSHAPAWIGQGCRRLERGRPAGAVGTIAALINLNSHGQARELVVTWPDGTASVHLLAEIWRLP